MTNYATNSQTDKELLEKIDKELAAGHAVLETVATTAPPAPPATTTTDTKPAKPKRTYLKVSDRMRIIDQFKHGIADPYYSVNPNPKKPGEYIVRKRKTPITYDLNTNTKLLLLLCLLCPSRYALRSSCAALMKGHDEVSISFIKLRCEEVVSVKR